MSSAQLVRRMRGQQRLYLPTISSEETVFAPWILAVFSSQPSVSRDDCSRKLTQEHKGMFRACFEASPHLFAKRFLL